MRTSPAAVSFEEFVQARSGSLLRTALLLTGQNRAEAEDLLQLALERAYRHWSRACAADDPERYVRRILANLVLRYFDDLPEAEVAAMLGCSLGTVR